MKTFICRLLQAWQPRRLFLWETRLSIVFVFVRSNHLVPGPCVGVVLLGTKRGNQFLTRSTS